MEHYPITMGSIAMLVMITIMQSTECAGRGSTTCPRPKLGVSLGGVFFSKWKSEARRLPDLSNSNGACTQNKKSWWESSNRWSRSKILISELKRTLVKEKSLTTALQDEGRFKRRIGCNGVKPNTHTPTEEVLTCHQKNSFTPSGLKRICGVCQVIRTLAPNRKPRYLNEAVCESPGNSCFSNEGYCTQKTIPITLQRQIGYNPAYFVNENYNLRIGCDCEIYPGSVLLGLN